MLLSSANTFLNFSNNSFLDLNVRLESIEKKWLDGFLTGFKSDDSQIGVQSKLF